MLNPQFDGLEPASVLGFFSQILTIPRRSHEEQLMVEYLQAWAAARRYESKVDGHKNVVVFVPATPGFEDLTTLCLQAHTDMVCVGDTNWPILIERDGDWIRTKGQRQTLGADNGLGVAMAMAACNEVHGPLELLFTSDEEDDFSGCEAFSRDFFGMKSRLLVNLDTPHAGRITVASAGFVYLLSTMQVKREAVDGERRQLVLADLPGGHSGEDVHTFRGNALKLMGLLLSRLPEGSRLVTLNGGEKGNSIPMGCTAEVVTQGAFDIDSILGIVANARETLRCPGITFEVGPGTSALPALDADSHKQVVSLLRAVPNGVVQMNLDLEDLPDLSSTPSIIETKEDGSLFFKHQIRGATELLVDGMINRLQALYTSHGCEVELGHRGRSWMQDVSHPLVKATQVAFEQTGYAGVLSGNHGAIEPGTLCGDPQNPQFDAAVSFGVWIRDEHKQTERFSLASLERTYKALVCLLHIVS